ncbi:Hsp70 family protein [Magnetococcales bacterium HHB-1]
MSDDTLILGMDLGTTNSEVAIYQDGQSNILPITKQSLILPSCVGLADDGTLLVGEPARNQQLLNPEQTITSIKRVMGSDTKVTLGERDYTPQEISAIILRKLRQAAEKELGQKIAKAVITVPAYFSDAQRRATREAGEIAGLDVVRMINEPTAAALAYEANAPEGKKILIYDLGGGTFDVSVVQISEGIVEVLASHGDNQLGGDDFDQKIVDFILENIKEEHQLDPSDTPRAMARILRAAEQAKKTLSDHPFALIQEEYLLEKEGQPIHFSLELSRIDFEAMISPLIDKTLTAIHTALDDVKLDPRHIDQILLVGGSTRIPLIHQRLESEMRQLPRHEINPDLCVAMGAAIQGAILQGNEVSSVLVDVTPYTFGTAALGYVGDEFTPDCYVPLIRKNTPIPVRKTEAFRTSHDDQEEVEITVHQGENKYASMNIELGNFNVEGLSLVPAGNLILLHFDLDTNGILKVTATEKETGLEKAITIKNALTATKKDELEKSREHLNDMFETLGEMIDFEEEEKASTGDDRQEIKDDKEGHERREFVQAQALKEKASRLLKTLDDDEDRDEMINLIEDIQDAMDNEAMDQLQKAVEELTDIIFYLEN